MDKVDCRKCSYYEYMDEEDGGEGFCPLGYECFAEECGYFEEVE